MNSLDGFGLKPTNDGIIGLLKKKRIDPDFSTDTIREINFYDFDPWELPGFSAIQTEEDVWYFYCEPYHKYAKSKRVHRRTKSGYWKINGKGSSMKSKNSLEVIGTKKTLSFCSHGAESKKANIKWVMHEISVEDDPLYQKDFVVCRLERKRVRKLGVSTSDEDQWSPDLAACSNIDVTKDIISDLPPLDQNKVFKTNDVAEDIFSKTVELISHSRDHVAENIGLDSEVLIAGDNFISSPRNGVAEYTSLEPMLPPNQYLVARRNHVAENIGLDSEELAGDNLISYPRNDVAQYTSLEPMLPPNQYMVSRRNHVAETTSLVSQVLASDHLISYTRNHVAENTCEESQLLPSHSLVSYYRNHVAENISTESQLMPSHSLVYCSRNDATENTVATDHLISYSRNHVVENICAESQLLPSYGLVSSSRNRAVEITTAEPQLLAMQGSASYSSNHVAEIPSPELQQLANPNLISYCRNHVAENSSKELHLGQNDNPELLKLPNQHWFSNSTVNVGCIFEAEPQPPAEFYPIGGNDRPSNSSFLALQSNGSNSGCDLLNEHVDDLICLPRDFQNESSHEETEQTFTPNFNPSNSYNYTINWTNLSPDFNSSRSDGGVDMEENISDMDAKALDAWVNELSE